MMGMFNETTESMKLQIDTAKKCGLQYLLMDFGWYGPEFAKNLIQDWTLKTAARSQ